MMPKLDYSITCFANLLRSRGLSLSASAKSSQFSSISSTEIAPMWVHHCAALDAYLCKDKACNHRSRPSIRSAPCLHAEPVACVCSTATLWSMRNSESSQSQMGESSVGAASQHSFSRSGMAREPGQCDLWGVGLQTLAASIHDASMDDSILSPC